MLKFAELLADAENNIIIDEVLFDENALKNYAQVLNRHNVYYIGFFVISKLYNNAKLQEVVD